MEIVITIDVRDKFVIKNTHHDIFSIGQSTIPLKETLPIDSFAGNGPFTDQ